MANDVQENFIAFLNNDTTVRALMTGGAHENLVPQRIDGDYVWFQMRGRDYTHTFDEAAGEQPRAVIFDVECCSKHLTRAVKLCDAVRNKFPCSGTFGDQTIKGAFANDQSEDYVPLNDSEETGIHAQSLLLEICQ